MVNSESKRKSGKQYLEELLSRGRHHFTTQEARVALGGSADAVKLTLNRLRHQGVIATPARGFYVIVPAEYRSLGCLPAEQFIPALMEGKGLPYYAGLLSAAQYHGAAPQRPQQFQVLLEKNRSPVRCGRVYVKFIARKRLREVPVKEVNTARGTVRVSTPEATAIDLVGYAGHAGGLDQVATVLSELSEVIDPSLLPIAAATAPLPWAQRLGYLLDLVAPTNVSNPLQEFVGTRATEYTLLRPGANAATRQRLTKWKLIVNTDVEPEL